MDIPRTLGSNWIELNINEHRSTMIYICSLLPTFHAQQPLCHCEVGHGPGVDLPAIASSPYLYHGLLASGLRSPRKSRKHPGSFASRLLWLQIPTSCHIVPWCGKILKDAQSLEMLGIKAHPRPSGAPALPHPIHASGWQHTAFPKKLDAWGDGPSSEMGMIQLQGIAAIQSSSC